MNVQGSKHRLQLERLAVIALLILFSFCVCSRFVFVLVEDKEHCLGCQEKLETESTTTSNREDGALLQVVTVMLMIIDNHERVKS